MKARGIFVSILIILTCSLLFLYGCSSSNDSSGAVKSWHNPASLSDNISPDGQNAVNPQVAMDDNGNAIIVWKQSDGTYGQIFKSEYRAGIWTNPSGLSDNISPDGRGVYSPYVAMDNDGNATVIWTQGSGDTYKSEYRDGVWINPVSLSDYIPPLSYWGSTAVLEIQYSIFANALQPQVARDNNGNAIIMRQHFDGTNGYILKNEYRNGTWTSATDISNHFGFGVPLFIFSDYFRVAIDNNGNYIIAWTWSDGVNNQVFKSEYRNGTWTDSASLSDNVSPDGQDVSGAPQVAMDDNGNAIIVWIQSDGSNAQVFKSEYRNGMWTNPAALTDNVSPDSQNASSPQIAMDNNDNAIIVWQQSDGFNLQIFKSEYRNGAWTFPAGLTDNISPNGEDASAHQVAMDDNGNAIIVWQQLDGANSQIFKSEYRNDAWKHPSSLTDNVSPDGQEAGNPQVTMDNNGNAIIVWSQSDGTNSQIFKSEYR